MSSSFQLGSTLTTRAVACYQQHNQKEEPGQDSHFLKTFIGISDKGYLLYSTVNDIPNSVLMLIPNCGQNR
jgi:hypothetical protein